LRACSRCVAALNACRWDEQNALLVESHERVIAELAEEAEAKLAEEVLAAEGLRQDKESLEKEAAEVRGEDSTAGREDNTNNVNCICGLGWLRLLHPLHVS
jgi:hypothetical protein